MANPFYGPAGSPSQVAFFRLTVERERFNAALARYTERLKKDLDETVRQQALILVGRVQMRTPIATGRLRASIHATMYGEPAAFSYTDLKGKTWDGTLDYVPDRPGVAVVGTNVEYALPIEAGWSKQAPQGMFRISLAELREGLAKAVRETLARRGTLS